MKNLKKPICFLDLETTGLNKTEDRIIEIYILKKNPDFTEEEFHSRFNPVGASISPLAEEAHGISMEDLKDEPEFKDKFEEILEFIGDSDIGGYVVLGFDIPVLFEELLRVGHLFDYRKHRIFDSYLIWNHYEPRNGVYDTPRTLEGAYKRFLGTAFEGEHKAKNDVKATSEIFFNQLDEWNIEDLNELFNTTTFLHKRLDLQGKFVKNEEGEIVISFGKYANKTIHYISEKDPEYYRWIFEKTDMLSDAKLIARKIYEKFGNRK